MRQADAVPLADGERVKEPGWDDGVRQKRILTTEPWPAAAGALSPRQR